MSGLLASAGIVGNGTDEDEDMVVIAGEYLRVEGILSLAENDDDDVVADVTLAVELLGVAGIEGKERSHVDQQLHGDAVWRYLGLFHVRALVVVVHLWHVVRKQKGPSLSLSLTLV